MIGEALDRYVPRDGWAGDWRAVVARSTPRPRRIWVVGAAVVTVAGAVFALVAGSILRSSSTAERPRPADDPARILEDPSPPPQPPETLVAIVDDDGRISVATVVAIRETELTSAVERCMAKYGAPVDARTYGSNSGFDDPELRAQANCRDELTAAADFAGSGDYRRAKRSEAAAVNAMRGCVARQMGGGGPKVVWGDAVDAPPAVVTTCVAEARMNAAEELAPATSVSRGVTPSTPNTVDVVVEGQRLTLPKTVTGGMDFDRSQVLGRIRGERFVSATQRATGDSCYVSFTASGGGTVGCGPRVHLVESGGWMISRRGVGGSREGLIIVPTQDGDLRFTTTPFFQVKAGSRLTVPGPDGSPRAYTVW